MDTDTDMNDLRNFEISASIVLDNRERMNRMQAKKGRVSFDAATKTFTIHIDEGKMVNQTFSMENILPLQRKQCPNGRVYVFQLDKPGFPYNDVFLRDIAEGDKMLVHNTLLKLVGVHQGPATRIIEKGSARQIPTISRDGSEVLNNAALMKKVKELEMENGRLNKENLELRARVAQLERGNEQAKD